MSRALAKPAHQEWHDKPLWQHHVEVVENWQRKNNPNEEAVAKRLSWLRTKSPEAFRYLCQNDLTCASIAVQHKWVVTHADDPQRGWGNRAAVQATLQRIQKPLPGGAQLPDAKAYIAALRAALERYAPENLDLLPPIS